MPYEQPDYQVPPPTVHVDYENSQWSEVEGLNVGDEVTIKCKAKVISKSASERDDEGKIKKCADICLEIGRMEVDTDAGTTELLHTFGE